MKEKDEEADAMLYAAELRAKYSEGDAAIPMNERVPKRPGAQWGLVNPLTMKVMTKQQLNPTRVIKDYSRFRKDKNSAKKTSDELEKLL